jgi:hypothetical protein
MTVYIKSQDLVVPARFPRGDAEQLHPRVMPRPLPQLKHLLAREAIPAAAAVGIELTSETAHQEDLDRGGESKEFEIFE